MKSFFRASSIIVTAALLASLFLQTIAAAAPLSPAVIEQLRLEAAAKNSATRTASISSSIDTSTPNPVRVIVQFSGQPSAAGKYAATMGTSRITAKAAEAAVRLEQTSVLSTALIQGVQLKVNYQFNTVLNGVEITIPANQIPQLAALPGVLSIYENRIYIAAPVEDAYSSVIDTVYTDIAPIKQIGADEAWNKGFTGKGLKIGVIDSGIDYHHPDLKDAYKGGYDSFNKDSDPYEDGPVSQEDDPYGTGFAGSYHGTHVAGTIVARAANTAAEIQHKGIAYEADLYAYKVMGYTPMSSEAVGTSAQIIDGIERAVNDGMDVINLSLGTDLNKDPNSPMSIAINNAVLSGVVAVVASGNAASSGPYYYSMGSPATAQLAMTVGAVTSPVSLYSGSAVSSFDSGLEYPLQAMAWLTGHENFSAILGTEPLDTVYAGLGSTDDYEGIDASGKIVFLSRGSIPFADKISNAKLNGAKAIIIFNGIEKTDPVAGIVPDLSPSIEDRDGFIEGGFLGDDLAFIPTFVMSGMEGRALAQQVAANPATPLQFTFGADYPATVIGGDHVAPFSSRGPNSDSDFSIKPDFTAPGVGILSTFPEFLSYMPDATYEEAYARLSGTSMAAPHVAGLSLLLLQQHPDWTPFDIRAALANTATPLYDETSTLYDVYSQGAGRVNIAAAMETPAIIQALDTITILDKNLGSHEVTNPSSSISFGLMQAGSAPASEQLQVRNFSDDEQQYKTAIMVHGSVTTDPYQPIPSPDPFNIEAFLTGVDDNDIVTIAPGAAAPLSLQIAPSANAPDGVYEGEVVLTSLGGLPTLHLPFAVHIGDERPDNGFGLQDLVLSNRVISPGITGIESVHETSELAFTLQANNTNALALIVYDKSGSQIGFMHDSLNLDDADQLAMAATGRKSLPINGIYYDFNEQRERRLQDGQYTLELLAAQIGNDGKIAKDEYNQPIIYSAFTTIAVDTDDEDVLKVVQARRDFIGQHNDRILNQPALQFPSNSGITYKVTDSNKPAYIDKDGILRSLPASGSENVTLTVTITSAAKPSIKTSIPAIVTLKPIDKIIDIGGGGGGGGGFVPPVVIAPDTALPAGPEIPDNSPSIAAVIDQGQFRSAVKPALTSASAGNTVQASVADTDLQQALNQAASSPVGVIIKVPVTGNQQAQLTLSPSQAAMLSKAADGSTIILSTGQASVALPATALTGLPADASVRITVGNDTSSSSAFTAAYKEAVILGTPVSFEVDVLTNAGTDPLHVPIGQFITRSFTISGSSGIGTVGVLYLEDGRIRPAAAAFTPNSDGTITVAVSRPGFSVYAAAAHKVQFTDIRTSWAKSQIQSLADKFLMKGTSETTFAPKQKVTRAEFAAMLARALGLQASGPAPFDDVRSTDWFAQDVAAAYEAGLITGMNSASFAPGASISRQDLTVMLARALKLLDAPAQSPQPHRAYSDVSSFAAYAKESIEIVTASGLMKGVEAGGAITFQPSLPTTREAAASVIHSLLLQAKLINN
ncbi:S8 family serine peptidase [Paenibacillus oenotherae]|uniref:S8 family serine peptidase n=1 Tax=Paenibacillus oenotherae TaxID=1435645 RepID=A0ABS7D946_9BACL|nr:S8 family serine peptidase [Paenibacillus oenotherae]MBW7476052.1 S8 family serine peptidase [Paenibacillus oenotherae]